MKGDDSDERCSGTIKAIIGQVFAISPDGSRRLLVEGDKILAGEQLETGANGAVTLTLPDGKTLDLGRDRPLGWHPQYCRNPKCHRPNGHCSDTASHCRRSGSYTNSLKPLPQARKPQLGSGEPGAGGAHTHVILDLTGEIVDPTAGYPTEGLDFPDTPIAEELHHPRSRRKRDRWR
ncbi:Uncharacterised protein [Kluyvera cryocrescens]|uniref:Uncharacterized protein n=1 Tax=Kluyvera cryocrescens TaxID=580 RepID=A0A485A8B4_KLUCR|nr:Uncharacterised protein [Kluyvera cryocrescens]